MKSQRPLSIAPLNLPADVTLTMPGSKSHANRAIICACLAKGTTVIANATPCDDVVLLVENLQKMGYSIEWMDKKKGKLKIAGGTLSPLPPSPLATCEGRGGWTALAGRGERVVLDCSNAGTTLRFLTALACITTGHWIITGDERMRRRPIRDLVKALRQLGANIEDTNGCPPITVRGGSIHGGNVTIDASKSSQFLTALMLIEPALAELVSIKIKGKLASPGYIDLTKKVMRDFGIQKKGDRYRSPKNGSTSLTTGYAIEGDWSAAGAWLVLEALTRSRIRFTNLDPHSTQADAALPAVMKRMRKKGDLTINCSKIPDQMMNLAVLAAFRKGKTTLTGIKNLHLKECDRVAVIVQELKKAGVRIKENNDVITIQGSSPTLTSHVSHLTSHADHRMAMAFAILGLLRPGIVVSDPACVNKSYPAFFDDLKMLHHSPRCIAIIGMRGVGKTTLARKLAKKLHLRAVDTDAVFVKQYGAIGVFVKKHGWPSFRKHEEEIVAASLQPGRIVSLGGGAIESAKTRKILKEESVVIWMQATPELIISRLQKSKRPALTKKPLEREVREVMKKRNPLYRETANIMLRRSECYDKNDLSIFCHNSLLFLIHSCSQFTIQ